MDLRKALSELSCDEVNAILESLSQSIREVTLTKNSTKNKIQKTILEVELEEMKGTVKKLDHRGEFTRSYSD